MESGPADWCKLVLNLLERRRLHEVAPFTEIINSYSEALREQEANLDELDMLKDQLGRAERKVSSAEAELQAIQAAGGTTVDVKKTLELEVKYEQLKEERTDLYKAQSINTQKLLDINERMKLKENEIQVLGEELKAMGEVKLRLERRIDDSKLLLEEKNLNIQIMQDELTALQLELLKTEERFSELKLEHQALLEKFEAKANTTPIPFALNNNKNHTQQPVLRPKSVEFEDLSGMPPHQAAKCGCPIEVVKHVRLDVESFDLVMSYSGTSFAVACAGKMAVHLFDAKTVEKKMELAEISKEGIVSVAFSPDDELVAGTTCRGDPSILIWNVSSGRIKSVLSGHEGRTASAGEDGGIRFWDIAQGFCLRHVSNGSPCTDIVSIPGSNLVLTGHVDGLLKIWDNRQAKSTGNYSIVSNGIGKITVGVGGRELIMSCRDHSIRVFDLVSRKPSQTLTHEHFRQSPKFSSRPASSPDGQFIAAGSSSMHHNVGGAATSSICIWNRAWKGELETCLASATQNPVVSVLWNDSGLVSLDRGGIITLWK